MALDDKKFLIACEDFLITYCHCYPDENGNRPCDYGALCNLCVTDEMQAIWKKIKEDLK